MSGKKYLLDTNIIIDFFKERQSVVEKLGQANKIYIPSIVTGELYFGAEISYHPRKNLSKLKGFLRSFEILNCTDETSERYAKIRKQLKEQGTPIPENDLWIASLAKQHSLTLATMDKHFRKVKGIVIEEW